MPEDNQKKKTCPDCRQCQMCSENRCRLCRKGGGCACPSELGSGFTLEEYSEWKKKRDAGRGGELQR